MGKRKSNEKIALLLLSFLLIGAITACSPAKESGKPKNDKKEDSTSVVTTIETEITPQNRLASFPDVDYEGYTIRILTTNNANSTLFARIAPDDTITGDLLNDALYERDRMIEEKYNVKIKYTLSKADAGDLLNDAKKAVMANEDSYDFIMGDVINVATGLSQGGYALNLKSVSTLDFSKEWWNKPAMDAFSFNNKCFFAIGDISPRNLLSGVVLAFNKGLFDDYGIAYPYESVRAGTWTIDSLETIIKDKTKDLNGDGVYDGEDLYGLKVDRESGQFFYESLGGRLVNTENGQPVLTAGNEKSLHIITRLTDLFALNGVDTAMKDLPYGPQNEFLAGKSFLWPVTAINLSMFTNSEVDFGIVPFPKYDVAQENYNTGCNPWALTGLCIPLTNPDPERTGQIVQAICAVSRYTSSIAAYDTTLLTKQTRDEESVEMLQLATDTIVMDIASVYNWGNISNARGDAILGKANFASKVAAAENVVKNEIQKLMEGYQ